MDEKKLQEIMDTMLGLMESEAVTELLEQLPPPLFMAFVCSLNDVYADLHPCYKAIEGMACMLAMQLEQWEKSKGKEV